MATEPCNSICFCLPYETISKDIPRLCLPHFPLICEPPARGGGEASDLGLWRHQYSATSKPLHPPSILLLLHIFSLLIPPPLNGKNRWVVFCGLPNWRFCNLKKENLSLGLPIHICIGQRNSLSLNLLLLVYYSRCKSCTMVQISLKMSPLPKVGLYLQKKSLSIDPNRLKTGPLSLSLSCQKSPCLLWTLIIFPI